MNFALNAGTKKNIMSKNKKPKKSKNQNVDIWTEEEYDEYMKGLYGMEFIAGYTEDGMPYGTFINEEDDC